MQRIKSKKSFHHKYFDIQSWIYIQISPPNYGEDRRNKMRYSCIIYLLPATTCYHLLPAKKEVFTGTQHCNGIYLLLHLASTQQEECDSASPNDCVPDHFSGSIMTAIIEPIKNKTILQLEKINNDHYNTVLHITNL